MVLRDKKIIIIAAVLFVAALSYVTILNNSMVADDYYFHSPAITQNAFKFFLQDMFPNEPDAVFLRPLPILVCAVESHFKGAFPVLPHVTNLLLHLATTVIIALLIMFSLKGEKKTGQSTFATSAGMLIFALHPQATGAVSFITARFDIMCGLFGTIGIYAWLNSVSKSNYSRWRLIAIIAFALSVLSKETGIIFAAAVFLWELWRWVINRSSIKAKKQIAALCQLAGFAMIYCVYRYFALAGMGGYQTFGFEHFSIIGPSADIMVLFWPFAKTGPIPSIAIFVMTVLFAVLIIFLVSRQKTNTDDSEKSQWLLFILVCVLPSTLFLFSQNFLTIRDVLEHAESRYSYVPLIGFSIIMAMLLNQVRNYRIGKIAVPVFLSLLIFFYVWSQQGENLRWTNASRKADLILSQTVALVPAPNENATLIFHRVPLCSDRWHYVFGIGLAEALSERYERSDLKVVRFPEKAMLKNPPNNSYIFKFDNKNLKMKLIHEP